MNIRFDYIFKKKIASKLRCTNFASTSCDKSDGESGNSIKSLANEESTNQKSTSSGENPDQKIAENKDSMERNSGEVNFLNIYLQCLSGYHCTDYKFLTKL